MIIRKEHNDTVSLYETEPKSPFGGAVFGNGFTIVWRSMNNPNGATMEAIIRAMMERLNRFQQGPLPSEYNQRALQYLHMALEMMEKRTEDRKQRNVEGTDKP